MRIRPTKPRMRLRNPLTRLPLRIKVNVGHERLNETIHQDAGAGSDRNPRDRALRGAAVLGALPPSTSKNREGRQDGHRQGMPSTHG